MTFTRAERAARYQEMKISEQTEKDRLAKMKEEQERAARNAAFNRFDFCVIFLRGIYGDKNEDT